MPTRKTARQHSHLLGQLLLLLRCLGCCCGLCSLGGGGLILLLCRASRETGSSTFQSRETLGTSACIGAATQLACTRRTLFLFVLLLVVLGELYPELGLQVNLIVLLLLVLVLLLHACVRDCASAACGGPFGEPCARWHACPCTRPSSNAPRSPPHRRERRPQALRPPGCPGRARRGVWRRRSFSSVPMRACTCAAKLNSLQVVPDTHWHAAPAIVYRLVVVLLILAVVGPIADAQLRLRTKQRLL